MIDVNKIDVFKKEYGYIKNVKYRENLKNLKDLKGLELFDFDKGTTVHMQLSNSSKKNLKEVFDMFAKLFASHE